MSRDKDDRDSLGLAAATVAVITSSARAEQSSKSDKPIKLGFVGLGGRGSYHLDSALGLEGVEVSALSEIQEDRLERARSWVEEADRPVPVSTVAR